MRPLHTGICKTCKVPTIWAKDSVLDGDNTSLQKMLPIRGVFYESDEIRNLITGIRAVVGTSLERVMLEAHKRAVRLFFQGTLKGITGLLARKAAPGMIYEQQAKAAPNFGVGIMEVAEYSRGGPLVIVAKNVYDEILFAGDVGGSFEAVEGLEGDVEYEESDGGYRIIARRAEEEKEEYRGRLIPLLGELMGTPEYPRCHVCGAPVSFQIFAWDREKGEIRERDNGIRVVHQTEACVDSLMQGLIEELGEDVRGLAVRAQADYVREKTASGAYGPGSGEGGPERKMFDYLSLIRRRCMGNPLIVDLDGEKMHVEIRNPGNNELLTGRTLGTYEAVLNRKGAAKSEQTEGTLLVDVSPG